MTRPGGRSARIQKAVHAATRELLVELPRAEVSIPRIAERAEVDPTTIYRRWGTLAQLLSDVAADRIRENPPAASTGSLEGDLVAWGEQYAEELSSGPGRSYIADVLAGDETGRNTSRCSQHAAESVDIILARFPERISPTSEQVLERLVAPLIYRMLFDAERSVAGYPAQLVAGLMADAG